MNLAGDRHGDRPNPGALDGARREQGRRRPDLLQVLDDRQRLGERRPVRFESRHEPLRIDGGERGSEVLPAAAHQ